MEYPSSPRCANDRPSLNLFRPMPSMRVMKTAPCLLAVMLIWFPTLVCSQTDVYDSINVGGRWRTYMTHLPAGYNAAKRYPLVFAFHGGSPLGYQSIQFQSRLSQTSDREGFVLVYPEGARIAGARTYNAGACCAPATTLNIDDVGFVDALLTTLLRARSIDSTRVYATGFSNGALLCYRLANELSSRIAAIAPVAGCLVTYPWAPRKTVPIISFHSYLDQNVKYQGGVTTGTTGTYFPPQDSMLGVIGSDYLCTVRKDTLHHEQGRYDQFLYSDCTCGAVIEQYVSYDGEHSWPGGQATGTVTVSDQFNATDLMWQFFTKYTTACGPTGVVDEHQVHELRVYPNPFTRRIELSGINSGQHLRLVSVLGLEVWHGTEIQAQDFSVLPAGLYSLIVDGRAIMLLKNGE